VLQAANERKRVTKALLDNAQVLDLTGRTLTLAFTTAALSRQFQAGSNIEVLKESLQAVLGLDADIALVVAGEQPPLPAASRAPEPSQAPPAYDGFAPGDEIDPEDPEAPRPERQVGGEDAALKLVADQLGGTVVGTVEP
jgi:DNA polymerase-3 subunit gamma/tau